MCIRDRAHAGCEEEDQSPVCLDGRGKRRTFQTTDTEPWVSDFYAIMGDLYHIKKMNVEAYAAYDSALVYKENNR